MPYKSIVVIPDLQIPYHDAEATTLLTHFVEEYEPDELWCVGDEIDAPEPARWSKGMAAEYAGQFWEHVLHTRSIMRGFATALGDKPFHVMRSNHAERIETYIRRYAPVLTSLPHLRIDGMIDYPSMGVTYHRELWEGAPGWLLAHGDEGGLRHTAGGTAVALARKVGKSVVCGHTHRMGLIPETTGFNANTSTLYGFEVGHLMDVSKAHYLKAGAANWQQGFGILQVDADAGRVFPQMVPIVDGRFVVDGYEYS